MSKKFIEWDNIYSVGIETIDKQHQVLFDLINSLYDNEEQDNIIKIINELARYAIYHFNVEEKFFKLTNYPFESEHEAEHQNFRERIKELKGNIENIDLDELFDFLVDWLVQHILYSDMKYAPYLKQELNNKKLDFGDLL